MSPEIFTPYRPRKIAVRAAVLCAGCMGAMLPATAMADPCTGPLPRPGSRFTGVVRHVIDGDGLCVGPAGRSDRWIEIRLADFYAPELRKRGGLAARDRLAALARGRTIDCVADHRSYGRVVAICTIGGRSIGARLREQGGREGGRGFHRRRGTTT